MRNNNKTIILVKKKTEGIVVIGKGDSQVCWYVCVSGNGFRHSLHYTANISN